MDTTHPVYMELYFQMRKREDLRSQEEIIVIALREWMEREYGQPTDRGYQWKDLFLLHGTRLRIIHRSHCYMAQVEGNYLMAEGKIITPNAWAEEICGSVRNAWRDIYVRRNYREAWTHASDLRAGAARHPLINRRQRARRSTD